jgi:LuxR family transcriptional regulator, maltose regulon positive regulatory protein
MTEGNATQFQGRRRIIERPRLTRLLDESQAKIKLLVAPAGYGKSTLARQWTAERPRAWYRVPAAAADVASVSRGIALAAADVLPGCSDRLAERLRITKNAEAEFETLAEMLVDDLEAWPREAWLVLDDAQHLLEREPTSVFAAMIVGSSKINALLCTRQRPPWITARDLLYGQALEIGRNSLAMTHEEAAAVMPATTATPGVVALADGWPAVVGLAALTPETALMSGMTAGLPEALYDYLAEELYQGLDPQIRDSMCLIAVAGVRSRRLVEQLFPAPDQERALREVVEAGWLTSDADENLELHPLLEAFLRHKLDEEPARHTRPKAKRVVSTLIAEKHWDEAFSVIDRYVIDDAFLPLLRAALDDLLASGRTATLRKWLDHAERRHLGGPESALTVAEVLFREGRFHESEVRALRAAEGTGADDRWLSRALAAAGRAAHAANREHEALSHYMKARAAATTAEDLNAAALGELAAAIDLELPEAPSLLAAIAPAQDDAEAIVAHVSRSLVLASRSDSNFDIQDARRVYRILHLVRDPVVRCSFRNAYGNSVAQAGDLDEAIHVVASQIDDATHYRLDFVIHYAHLISALIDLVRGDLDRVHDFANSVGTAGHETGDDLLTVYAILQRARAQIMEGKFRDAVSESFRAAGNVTPSARGDVLATRAIALACDGDETRAVRAAEEARRTTRATEVLVASSASLAIVALRRGTTEAFDSARSALSHARFYRTLVPLITAYRGFPELAHVLLRSDETREAMLEVLSLASDAKEFEEVARTRAEAGGGTWEALSPREREVLALAASGLSNRKIAQTLFIAEATVKVHMSHVFEKLGVNSRAAAAVRVPHHARLMPPDARGPEPEQR